MDDQNRSNEANHVNLCDFKVETAAGMEGCPSGAISGRATLHVLTVTMTEDGVVAKREASGRRELVQGMRHGLLGRAAMFAV